MKSDYDPFSIVNDGLSFATIDSSHANFMHKDRITNWAKKSLNIYFLSVSKQLKVVRFLFVSQKNTLCHDMIWADKQMGREL